MVPFTVHFTNKIAIDHVHKYRQKESYAAYPSPFPTTTRLGLAPRCAVFRLAEGKP